MINQGILVVAAAFVLSACVGGPQTTEPVRSVQFLCDRGQQLTVTFKDGYAHLEGVGIGARLQARPVGSGIHYAGDGHEIRGKGPEVVWTRPTGAVLTCRDQEWAMRQPQIEEPPASLAGTSWRLVHFQSSNDAIGTTVPPRVERYTLAFVEDGNLALGLDCNRATGRWQADPASAKGGSLSISVGAMTRAMCGPEAIDTKLAMDMADVRSFTLAEGRLNLALMADAGVYVWAPATDDQP